MRKPEIEQVELNPTQAKQWTDTKFAMTWEAPCFTHVFYEMMGGHGKQQAVFTKSVPVAATDGAAMLLNPDTYFDTKRYNIHNRVFIGCHEILHGIFDYCGIAYECMKAGKVSFPDGTTLPYEDEFSQKAMDYVVNAILVASQIGEKPKDALFDTNIATENDSWIDAYRKVYKEKPTDKGGQQGDKPGQQRSQCGGGGGVTPGSNQPGQGQPTGNFDEHLEPGTVDGTDAHSAGQARDEAKWKAAVQAGLTSARMQGKLPAGLERVLGEVLEPKVTWQDHIHSFFARRLGNGRYDWRQVDRRLIVRDIIAPGRSSYGAECVVVAQDTSGSINDEEITMAFGEMAGVLEDVKPKRLVVIWCDAHVDRVDELDDASDLEWLRKNPGKGGGGTDFRPVFEEIAEMGLEPDALIYFTDSFGSFPAEAPTYPVLWGDITGQPEDEARERYPFGDVVCIPRQASLGD